jgi:hypothetical protein
VAGRGDPRGHHAEALPVRGHRRHRRGHDHQHSRGAAQQRNWDYRYCWLRDAFFVVRALNSLSEVGTMESYLRWLYNVVRGRRAAAHVQPLYGIGLERSLPERIIDQHCPGYRGMGPVRVGNQAHEHFQHDVYGSIVLGAAQAFHDHRLFRRGDSADFAALEGMGERAWALHDQPDAGIWELRTPRAGAHLVGADVLGRLRPAGAHAGALGLPERQRTGRARAEVMRAHPAARLERQAQRLRREPGRRAPGRQRAADGRGRLPAREGPALREHRRRARMHAVRRAVHAPLRGRPTTSAAPRTAFNVCSFWRVDALARIGRRDEAREIFEALLARRNPWAC